MPAHLQCLRPPFITITVRRQTELHVQTKRYTRKMTSNNGICVLWKQELEDFNQSSIDEDGGIFLACLQKQN